MYVFRVLSLFIVYSVIIYACVHVHVHVYVLVVYCVYMCLCALYLYVLRVICVVYFHFPVVSSFSKYR